MPDLLLSHPWLGTARYTVCVAVAGASSDEMMRLASNTLLENPFLELRLDSLPEPRLFVESLGDLLQRHPEAKLVATCRRRVAGGRFKGSLEDELAILQASAKAGCSIVDLSLETAEAMRLEQHHALRAALQEAGAALLLSYHDYQETRDLHLIMARLLRHQPDLIKVVSTANRLADNLPVLALLSKQYACPLVAIAMGEPGIVSRVLGPCAGGLFTFASAGPGAETAPGQVTASTLRELYRIDQISAATRVYGVAGKPIEHSLSPLLHNTGFRSRGIDAVFLPLLVDTPDDLLMLVHRLPVDGLSVTMPLKQAILPLLDHIDPLAARVGACNTVVHTATGELHGYNTDVAGVTAPLEKRLSLKGARVLVHGAGGAARAAVFGLVDKGAEVWILNRTVATAVALAAEAGAHVAESSMLIPGGFDVLVNATPLGMHDGARLTSHSQSGEVLANKRADSQLSALEPLPANLIFDMVYRPLETPLIVRARAQGLPVITGVEMFVHQGARQFELWTGQAAPEAEMLRILLDALGAVTHQ